MIDFTYKILVPQRPAHLVSRQRLTAIVHTITERRLLTISAPAGYGKTSLLIDFAHADLPFPVCWYTLDRFDADPWMFLSYLTAAITQQFPSMLQQTRTLLAGQSRASFSSVAATLVHDVYTLGHHFVLIIDDWHLVDQVAEISDVIAHMLLRCPNCHLILASRIYPGLPDMMLLAARRQMSGLDEAQLRFTVDEAAAVLQTEQQPPVALEQMATLVEQTNGWITGILLALQATGVPSALGASAANRGERHIYRFLAEQVFDQQPPEIRTFLRDSALLDELTVERCNTYLGRQDAASLLETLLRNHIFITEIRPGVLRYHPLFHEFLHDSYRQDDPQRYREMSRQVAAAYAAQEHWTLAFERYITADDRQSAQQIVMRGGDKLYTSGRMETLEGWFAAFSLEELGAPLLCLKARVLLDRGQPREAQVLADLAETRMQAGEETTVLLIQALLARLAGQYHQAIDIAHQVLDRATDLSERSEALRTLAICHHLEGQSTAAIEELQDALTIERQRGDLYAVARLQHDLGVCYEEYGQIRLAEKYYSQAEAYWTTIGNLGRRALSLNSKGVVQHLSGRYHEAYSTLNTALAYARDAMVSNYQALVLTSLGDLYSDIQLWERARAAYDEAHQFDRSAQLNSYLELAVVRLLIRQRQYTAAARALDPLSVITTSRYDGVVLLLQSSIAWGLGQYEQAIHLVATAIHTLEQTRALLDLARAYLWQAHIRMHHNPADKDAWIASLEQAARITTDLGHDAFLVAETLHFPGVLRYAQMAGWKQATVWYERHADIHLAAQMIEHTDQRPVLVIRTLGSDQILVNGQATAIGWLKAREVLYYLLAHPDGATPEELREAIWPDLHGERSRGALKTAIYQLRSALPPDVIELQRRQIYRLNPDAAHIDYDVARFLRLLDTLNDDREKLFAALDLYRGLYLPWSDNHWSVGLRTYLEQRYLQALRLAAEQCLQQQIYAEALLLYQRILAVDAMDEAAHAGIMRCHLALGNRAAAIEQYRDICRIFDQELGLELGSSSEVAQLYQQILAQS